MLWTSLILLPLALARPHLPAHRRHAIVNRPLPLVERAGAAYDNETQAEISAWNHDHESVSPTATVAIASSSAVSTADAVQAVGTALTAVNTPSSSAVPSSTVQSTEVQV
jgi:hypothetical protein